MSPWLQSIAVGGCGEGGGGGGGGPGVEEKHSHTYNECLSADCGITMSRGLSPKVVLHVDAVYPPAPLPLAAFEDHRFFLWDGVSSSLFKGKETPTRRGPGRKSSGLMSSSDDTVAWYHRPTFNCHKRTTCLAEHNLCRRAKLTVLPEIVYRERATGSTPGCQDRCRWKRVVADVMRRTLDVPFISPSRLLGWLWRRRQVRASGCAITAFTWKVERKKKSTCDYKESVFFSAKCCCCQGRSSSFLASPHVFHLGKWTAGWASGRDLMSRVEIQMCADFFWMIST